MRLESKKACKRGEAALCVTFLAGLLAALLSACSSSLDARLSADSASFESAAFTAELSPAAKRLAQAFLGQEAVFDKERIEEAFAAIDFPSPASVSVDGDGGGQLKIEFSRINLDEGIFLSLADGGTRAFSLDAGEKTLAITLTRETIAKTIAALPNELFEYADLLMAPVLTGERMSEEQYLSLIAAAYGPQAAAELKGRSFELTVQCPGKVTAASAREFAAGALGGASSPAADVQAESKGNIARFSIPAVKVFVLSSPLQLVVGFGD